ncbi:hypothetical protein ACLUUI_05635 [Enterobacterales bacterium AW_CKDN230030176-1A_HGKHYDSX7]
MRADEYLRSREFRSSGKEPDPGAFKRAGNSPLLEWVEPGPKKPSSIEIFFISIFAIALCAILIFTPSGLLYEITLEAASKVTALDISRVAASIAVALLSTLFITKKLAQYVNPAKDRTKKFIDIDYEREYLQKIDPRFHALQKQILELKKENRELHEIGAKKQKENESTRQNEHPKTQNTAKDFPNEDSKADERNPLENHIYGVIDSLENHINISDKKASNLLDTGTMYLRRGIYFYVASIFVWQVVAQFRGVDQALIFGIASCSFTFLVVEFLAAWFLKQYRNFNDSSMQFMKVKSVYDRYLLSYHALNQFSPEGTEALTEARTMMLAVLEKEARWPELTNLKTADVNHMAQIFESIGGILDKAKSVVSKET